MSIATSTMIHRQRVAQAADALKRQRSDALLLLPGADLFYLTGFHHSHAGERLLGLVVQADGSSSWIVPAMNESQVRERALPEQPVRLWSDAQGYLPGVAAAIGNAAAVAFDDEGRGAFLLDLISLIPTTRVTKASSVMRGLRIRKSAPELEALRSAARTVDQAISRAFSLCRPGRTEAQIDQLLRESLLGASPDQKVSFTIIAGGENSALPHHETSNRPLQTGDVVAIDFGTNFSGYHSDITVVCAAGEPGDPETRRVYRTVWEAQQAAIEIVRPGISCGEVDRAARAVIEAAGYGPHFLHRTGHGLGLQLHEPPFMVEGNPELLEEGMVFSIEPGIYLPGRFGVRLEVIVSVTRDGVSLINAPSRPELPVVD